jgi:Arc/MetJ-type ribon-helix-helix transcriptional regulator
MVFGMATRKITVTLPDEQLTEVRSLVAAGRAANVSAFVQHAVALALADAAGWREMLKEALDQTGGPLTAAEKSWADAILTARKTKPGPHRRNAA